MIRYIYNWYTLRYFDNEFRWIIRRKIMLHFLLFPWNVVIHFQVELLGYLCTILSWQMPIDDEKWVYIHFQEIKSSCISHNCKKEIENNKNIKNSPSYMQIRKTCANAYKFNQKLLVIWSCKGKHNPCLFISKSFMKKKANLLSTTRLSPLSRDEWIVKANNQ